MKHSNYRISEYLLINNKYFNKYMAQCGHCNLIYYQQWSNCDDTCCRGEEKRG